MTRTLLRGAFLWDLRRWFRFWPAIVLAVLCVLVALGGEEARLWLRYERSGLAAGQWWRLVTAHLAHLGWGHLWLNLVGLALVAALFDDVLNPGEWVAASLAGAGGIAAALYFLAPDIDWYVGLSGVLHALLAAGTLKLLAARSVLGLLLVGVLVGKLAWEQWLGPLPFSGEAAGPVIVEAHLYGAVAGALAGLGALAVHGARAARL